MTLDSLVGDVGAVLPCIAMLGLSPGGVAARECIVTHISDNFIQLHSPPAPVTRREAT